MLFRYPGLTRRTLTNEERKKLIEMGHSQHVAASSITLLVRYLPFSSRLFNVTHTPTTSNHLFELEIKQFKVDLILSML